MLISINYPSRPLLAYPCFILFSLCSTTMQALAASRLISADLPTSFGLPAFHIEQITGGGGLGKKEYKHNCFFLCLLTPLIFFLPRLSIPPAYAEPYSKVHVNKAANNLQVGTLLQFICCSSCYLFLSLLIFHNSFLL